MVQEDLIWADLLLSIVCGLENMRLNLMKLSLMIKSAAEKILN